MRATALASLTLLLLPAGFVEAALAELPPGRGVLLPLQDRVGEPDVTRLTETHLRRELEAHAELAGSEEVRAVLRSLRVRDASDEPPDRLAALARDLGVEWFFLATLHEARASRKMQRLDDPEPRGQRIEDTGDTPQIALSATVLRPGSEDLWWAGFDGSSGRDGERAFGLGRIETLEELAQISVERLVSQAAEPRDKRDRSRLRLAKDGYLRSSAGPSPSKRVAVIPMDSVASLAPSASAEVATAALFATLDDFGFTTLLPGFVRSIREETGQIRHGSASRPEWEALARETGADWIATGTVETYRRGLGRTPDPRVALSVRLLDPGDGRIDWINGLERTGSDTASAFDRGRIYSTGDLTYQMVRSLLGGLVAGSRTDETAREN